MEGAGLGEDVDAGEEGSWVDLEGVVSGMKLMWSSYDPFGPAVIPEAFVLSASAALGKLTFDDDRDGTSEG